MIGNQRVDEWDDINIDIFLGDHDPLTWETHCCRKKKNIVISSVRDSGRTRILVPAGVAIKMEHSTFIGTVIFEGESKKV